MIFLAKCSVALNFQKRTAMSVLSFTFRGDIHIYSIFLGKMWTLFHHVITDDHGNGNLFALKQQVILFKKSVNFFCSVVLWH